MNDECSNARAVPAGTIAVYSDLACPWAHLAVHCLHEARSSLGLDGRVVIEPRAYPLELANGRATPKRVLDAETPVVAALAPEAGWRMWAAPSSEWPVTSLPALEAVQAARSQGAAAAEQLDRALRRALFAESRCISLRTIILEVAAETGGVDVDLLAVSLDDGRARSLVIRQWREAADGPVQGSPHLFLADGGDAFNPGVSMRKLGEGDDWLPVVDAFDPAVYEPLLRRAAGGSGT